MVHKNFFTPFSFDKLSSNHVNISFHLVSSLVHFIFFLEWSQQSKLRVSNTRHKIKCFNIRYSRWYSQLMMSFNLGIWSLSYKSRWIRPSLRRFMPQKSNNWKQEWVYKPAFHVQSIWMLWVSKYCLNRGERNIV